MDCNIIPLFPSIVCEFKLENDYTSTFLNIKTTTEFAENAEVGNFTSKKFNILDTYTSLGQDILNVFNLIKDNVLYYTDTEFAITTSWVTKTVLHSQSQYHNHKNCFYSGVLYFDDIENCANIEFSDDNLKPESFMVNNPSKLDIYNCKGWSISPQKNKILFFPSYLKHRISKHMSDTPRYSLAFNLSPVGVFGSKDSSMNVNLVK